MRKQEGKEGEKNTKLIREGIETRKGRKLKRNWYRKSCKDRKG